MNLEELKVIWDSQNKEPIYAVNEATLHTIVRRRKEAEHRRTAWCYGREIVINALCGVATFIVAGMLLWSDPNWLASLSWINVAVSPWHAAVLALAGGIWVYCAGYMWSARRDQRRREERYGTSLQDDLECALAHIDFQIRIARGITWWGLIPAWIAACLDIVVVFHLKDAPSWAYAMMVAVMTAALAMTVWCQHLAVRRKYEPRRRQLESLRAKLIDPRS